MYTYIEKKTEKNKEMKWKFACGKS